MPIPNFGQAYDKRDLYHVTPDFVEYKDFSQQSQSEMKSESLGTSQLMNWLMNLNDLLFIYIKIADIDHGVYEEASIDAVHGDQHVFDPVYPEPNVSCGYKIWCIPWIIMNIIFICM